MSDAPSARSVRHPNPDRSPLPPGVDYADEMDAPPSYGRAARAFYTGEADERARQERLAAPPTRKPVVAAEERARLVRSCAEAVLAFSPLVYGISDVLVRALADRLGVAAEEADALVSAEVAKRWEGSHNIIGGGVGRDDSA